MRQMNSISLTDLRKPQKIENENKMKKYLVKSESNGQYIQSRLIVAPEDLNVNTLNDQNNTNNNNNNNNNNNSSSNNNNNNVLSSPNKNQNLSKKNSKDIDSINKNSSNNTPSKGNEKENSIKKSSSTGSNNQKEIDKEKIFHGLIQASNLANSNPNNTITINDNNIANILENNQITIRWCKICNMILPNDQDPNIHINKAEHQKIKKEYSLSIQEEANVIMIFKSIPGNINDELRNERVNAIKVRAKKLKQKMSLKAIKHENYFAYKQDFPSVNKQRIQKLAFDIEKQIYPNIKDYGTLENLLKDLIKILKQNI